MTFTDKIKKVLVLALQEPFKIQSDFARQYAHAVAACASRGLITTQNRNTPVGAEAFYGRCWFITMAGLQELNNIVAKEF